MPRISVPPDRDPMMYVWTELAKPVTAPAGALSQAVYNETRLPLREFEVARTRIAQINDCQVCKGWRTARDVPGRATRPDEVPEDLYEHVGQDWPGFTERERLAGEFAERFATDHLSMDEAFWARLRAAYSDEELMELAVCVGTWLAFGRLNRVFDIDGACRVSLEPAVTPVS
jgi:alkylhydroperoxidase family enzyme